MARILALDPGTRRCGVAVSDSGETMAFPRPALVVDDQIREALKSLCRDEEVELVVVGRPVSLAGAETSSTEMADEFYRGLEDVVDVPVIQVDERLTTTSAARHLREAGVSAREQRSRVDSAAAVVLLEFVLESRSAE